MDTQTDITLSFDEVLATTAMQRDWLLGLIEEEIIVINEEPDKAQFSGWQLARIRRAGRISRDFEASLPALSLIMQLLDEVEELRKSYAPLSLIADE